MIKLFELSTDSKTQAPRLTTITAEAASGYDSEDDEPSDDEEDEFDRIFAGKAEKSSSTLKLGGYTPGFHKQPAVKKEETEKVALNTKAVLAPRIVAQ